MFELMWPCVQAAHGELILDTVSKTGESWQLSSTSTKDERRAPCESVMRGAHCVAEEQAAPEQDRHLGTRLVRQHRAQQCWAMYACRLSPALAECKKGQHSVEDGKPPAPVHQHTWLTVFRCPTTLYARLPTPQTLPSETAQNLSRPHLCGHGAPPLNRIGQDTRYAEQTRVAMQLAWEQGRPRAVTLAQAFRPALLQGPDWLLCLPCTAQQPLLVGPGLCKAG